MGRRKGGKIDLRRGDASASYLRGQQKGVERFERFLDLRGVAWRDWTSDDAESIDNALSDWVQLLQFLRLLLPLLGPAAEKLLPLLDAAVSTMGGRNAAASSPSASDGRAQPTLGHSIACRERTIGLARQDPQFAERAEAGRSRTTQGGDSMDTSSEERPQAVFQESEGRGGERASEGVAGPGPSHQDRVPSPSTPP